MSNSESRGLSAKIPSADGRIVASVAMTMVTRWRLNVRRHVEEDREEM